MKNRIKDWKIYIFISKSTARKKYSKTFLLDTKLTDVSENEQGNTTQMSLSTTDAENVRYKKSRKVNQL